MNALKRVAIYVAAAFLAIAASLINNQNLYFMSALLIVLPAVSYGLGYFNLSALEFTRETPGSGWEGETATFEIHAQSTTRFARLFLQAEDILPTGLISEEEDPPLFNAAANAVTKIPYRVKLSKRGAYSIEQMRVTALDPLGLYAFSKVFHVESEMLVYPMPQEIPDFLLSGAERYGFRDLPTAATKGNGVDPDGVREYVPGDPLRRMHWKSTARTGKLSVIEFEESHAVNVVLALDLHLGTDVGVGRQSTLEYLVTAAASFAQLAIRQGASVRLVQGEEHTLADFAGRGTEHLFTILATLARAEAADPLPLSARLIERVGNLAPGTTLVALCAEPDPNLPGALAHYAVTGANVLLFYADPLSFQNSGRGRGSGEAWSASSFSKEAVQMFVEQTLAAGVTPYALRYNDEAQIRPEPIQDVKIFG